MKKHDPPDCRVCFLNWSDKPP